MEKVTSLKNTIEQMIADISENSNVFDHIKKTTLESQFKKLEKLEEILKIEKYKIVFVGTIGAGKTTAISHLFNLLHNVEKKIKKGKNLIDAEVVEPLLSTGSGRTTICEVIIQASEKTSIKIEPYTRKELEGFIEEFCDSFYKKDSNGNLIAISEEDSYDDLTTVGSSISVELERAIRTIVKLEKTTKQHKDENGKTIAEKIDLAEDKSKELQPEEFKKYTLNNAKLDERIYNQEDSKLFCPDGEEPKEWLKENFSKVNRAKIENFSIPKKIYVYVSKDIYGESQLDSFDSVIDTKGIDDNPIREDLTKYIDEDKTIVIFTSSYNDAPENNILELLQKSLSSKSKNYQDRFITLVMPKNNEPENENDGDGSWENGIELKKNIIIKTFKDRELNFIDENILFYDAMRFFDLYGRVDRDYDEDIQDDKNRLIKSINNVIDTKKNKLWKDFESIEASVKEIEEGVSRLSDDEKDIIDTLVNKLEEIRELDKKVLSCVYEDFVDYYVNYYATHYKYWNTKDAIHRRLGTFQERGYDTYFDAKVVAEEMLRKFTFTKDVKNEGVKNKVSTLIKQLGNDVKGLKSLTLEISDSFEKEYDKFIDSVGTDLRNFLVSENENEIFWAELINRRGQGRGYNDDVTKTLRNKLKTLKNGLSVDGIFRYYAEEEWEILINKIIKFFKQ